MIVRGAQGERGMRVVRARHARQPPPPPRCNLQRMVLPARTNCGGDEDVDVVAQNLTLNRLEPDYVWIEVDAMLPAVGGNGMPSPYAYVRVISPEWPYGLELAYPRGWRWWMPQDDGRVLGACEHRERVYAPWVLMFANRRPSARIELVRGVVAEFVPGLEAWASFDCAPLNGPGSERFWPTPEIQNGRVFSIPASNKCAGAPEDPYTTLSGNLFHYRFPLCTIPDDPEGRGRPTGMALTMRLSGVIGRPECRIQDPGGGIMRLKTLQMLLKEERSYPSAGCDSAPIDWRFRDLAVPLAYPYDFLTLDFAFIGVGGGPYGGDWATGETSILLEDFHVTWLY